MGWAHTIPSATFVRNCRLGSLSTGTVFCRSSKTWFPASHDGFVYSQVSAMPSNTGGSTARVIRNSKSTTIRLSGLLLPCVRVWASHWFSGQTIGEARRLKSFLKAKSAEDFHGLGEKQQRTKKTDLRLKATKDKEKRFKDHPNHFMIGNEILQLVEGNGTALAKGLAWMIRSVACVKATLRGRQRSASSHFFYS